MLDSDWFPKILLRSDWLWPEVALFTTGSDRLATHVFLFSHKNRIYKQNTYTHTQSGVKTLYFNFDSPLRKRFLRSISRKRLTIEISALDALMVLSIQAPLALVS